MALKPEQIARLAQIVRDASTALAITTMGAKATAEERARLEREGYIKLPIAGDLVWDSFALGQVAQQHAAAAGMSYDEFQAYLRSHPVALGAQERYAVEVAQNRAGTYCVGLGNRYSEELGRVLIDADQEQAARVRGQIRDATAMQIAERQTVKQLKSALGNLTQDWRRDWDRIAATESHQAHQEGFVLAVTEEYGDDELMAKVPEPEACEQCKLHYLEDGKPKVRPASWWMANGPTNAGRKTRDWKPVLGALHPHCFAAGQRIWTARGQVPIEQVAIGDWAVSAEGRWRRVTQTFRRYYIGPLMRIRAGERECLVTGNHPFLSGGQWVPAQGLKQGSQVVEMFVTEAQQAPPVAQQPRLFGRILTGFSRAGVPITAIEFDGQLARPIYEIDQIPPDKLIRLDGPSASEEGGQKGIFQLGIAAANAMAFSAADFIVREDAPPAAFVCADGQLLALDEGGAIHAELLRSRSISLGMPGVVDSLEDGASRYPELAGYCLNGEFVVEVEPQNQACVEVPPLRSVHSHIAAVSLAESQAWHGWVYNLSVDGDESFVAEGLAVHNCRCQMVRVPTGWAFNEAWDLVPVTMAKSDQLPGGVGDKKTPSDFPADALAEGTDHELEHTRDRKLAREIAMDHLTEDPQYYVKLRKLAKAEQLPLFIGPRGGKWADPKHTIAWHPSADAPVRSSKLAVLAPTTPHSVALKAAHEAKPEDFGLPAGARVSDPWEIPTIPATAKWEHPDYGEGTGAAPWQRDPDWHPDFHRYDFVLVNSSAGKDSQAMLSQVVAQADKAGYPRSKIIVVHADMGRAEWEGTQELAAQQAAHYGLRFEVVKRERNDLIGDIEERYWAQMQRYTDTGALIGAGVKSWSDLLAASDEQVQSIIGAGSMGRWSAAERTAKLKQSAKQAVKGGVEKARTPARRSRGSQSAT